jgi:hypothetical protein
LWPLKREYNAVSAIADEIWQYRTRPSQLNTKDQLNANFATPSIFNAL